MKVENNSILEGARRAVREAERAIDYLEKGELDEAVLHAWIAAELALNSIKAVLNGVITTKHARFPREAKRFYAYGILSMDYSADMEKLEKWRLWAEHAPYTKPENEPDWREAREVVERIKTLAGEALAYVERSLR